MNRPLDTATRLRALLVFKALVENPFHYSIKDFSQLYNVSKDAIRTDLEEIKNAGFDVAFDRKFRYALVDNATTKHLQDILYLNEAEKELIRASLHQSGIENQKILKLIHKVESIIDYARIGKQAINKAYISKIAMLEQAMADKQKVILKNYKSTNSNTVSDRILEVFHLNLKDDSLNAFDIRKQENRIFKISRIESIEQLDEDWENEGKHYLLHPDVFGIVNKNTVRICIKINLAGYNALIDRYPLAKAFVSADAQNTDKFILECEVNESFMGLTNYILGNSENILEILEPQSLIDHLNDKIKSIRF